MKARLPDSLLKRGRNEHPLQSTREASAIGNHVKTTRPEYFMRATLDVCVFFASTIANKSMLRRWVSVRAPDGAWRGRLTNDDAHQIRRQARSLTQRYL